MSDSKYVTGYGHIGHGARRVLDDDLTSLRLKINNRSLQATLNSWIRTRDAALVYSLIELRFYVTLDTK